MTGTPTPSAPPRPEARPVTVERHGEVFEDAYAWLRDRDDPAVVAHLEAENAWTEQVLGHLDGLRATIFDEIRSRVVETDASAPVPDGPWVYYHRTIEGQDYAVHCRRPADAPDARLPVDPHHPPADEQVLLDENVLADGHDYLAVGGLATSPDHRLLAYLVDTTGSEEYQLVVRDLQTGEDVEQVHDRCAYGLAWTAGSDAVFYTTPDEAWRPHRAWRHRLGEPGGPDHDDLLLEESDERFWMSLGATRSEDLVVISVGSKSTSEVHVVDAHDLAARPRLVAARRTGVEYTVDHDPARDRLVILTNVDDAVDFAVHVAPLATPGAEHWQVLVPHRPGVRVEDVDAFAGHLVLSERTQARTQVRVVDPVTGVGDVLPGDEEVATTAVGPTAAYDTTVLRTVVVSLVTPGTVVDRDLVTGAATVVKQVEVPGHDPDRYVSERRWAVAPDGTRIPISVVRARSTPVDGTAACLLYGYGAYEISIDPTFSAWRLSLLDRGGVFAIAHIRGGGEMGRAWYEAGRFGNKPTTFSDFAACADALVEQGVCSRERLAIEGGSAGGLLVGATLNLRPDLCRAAVAAVPFVDVVNTMSDPTLPLTIPEYEEWGDPSEAAAFAAMRAYSPYDNIRPEAYPALLVTAGLNDPRVGYWEPAKWVARLRDVTTGDRPILLKTELGAGHGGPSGRYDAWRERALFAAFTFDQVGLVDASTTG